MVRLPLYIDGVNFFCKFTPSRGLASGTIKYKRYAISWFLLHYKTFFFIKGNTISNHFLKTILFNFSCIFFLFDLL